MKTDLLPERKRFFWLVTLVEGFAQAVATSFSCAEIFVSLVGFGFFFK